MTIEEARELLGIESANLSDKDLLEAIEIAEFFVDIFIAKVGQISPIKNQN